jgi:hypothetical protein
LGKNELFLEKSSAKKLVVVELFGSSVKRVFGSSIKRIIGCSWTTRLFL